MAIGRLDYDSEGLLLLTTDGKQSELIRSKKVEKEYYVQIDGIITTEAITKLQEGVIIKYEGKNYLTKPCKAIKLKEVPSLPKRAKNIRDAKHGPTSWVSIVVREGKFRQVRKMTAAVGFPTLRLVRIRIGDIHIDNMIAGEVNSITSFSL